jgi:chorismate mutase/prephenate dehydratase
MIYFKKLKGWVLKLGLDELRSEIDAIDTQLINLFEKRMRAAKEVAEIKLAEGLPIYNSDREKKILDNICESVSFEYSLYAYSFFYYILELSKTKQREIIRQAGHGDNFFSKLIKNPVDEIAHPDVVAQGVLGAYSNTAAMAMYPDNNLTFVTKWEDVLNYITDGFADYGILPVENSSAGSVTEVYDLLLKYKLFIVKVYAVNVDHYLLGVRGSNINDIKEVYSQAHAFPQCSAFLNRHHKMVKMPYVNTAMAAQMVARDCIKTKAAIASKECAHLYGLDILAESIQNSNNNCTRFVSVSKKIEIHENANKISVVFTLPHITGSLYRTLSLFALNGLNLTKIESRPNPDKNFEYFFYLDFTGSLNSKNTVNLLSALSEELPNFYFLGSYYES